MNKGKYSTISDPIDVSSTLLIREPEVQAYRNESHIRSEKVWSASEPRAFPSREVCDGNSSSRTSFL